VLGGETIAVGGTHSRPSEYDGRTPRDGPPPPTSGPVPPSSAGFVTDGIGAGICVGTALGAVTWISRDFSGRPSPPTLPAVGLAPGCASLTNPTRSCGTVRRFGFGEISPFRISIRMNAIATTTCTPTDTRKAGDSCFLAPSGGVATRRKIIRRGPSPAA